MTSGNGRVHQDGLPVADHLPLRPGERDDVLVVAAHECTLHEHELLLLVNVALGLVRILASLEIAIAGWERARAEASATVGVPSEVVEGLTRTTGRAAAL